MIQHTHLTAWQTHAPWPKRSQIEQDLRLSRGVAAIFADSVLSEHLAMRGGTVLHKAHLAPAARYSQDIDLVHVKAMDTLLRPGLPKFDVDEGAAVVRDAFLRHLKS